MNGRKNSTSIYDGLVVSKDLLDEILATKKSGFSKAELKCMGTESHKLMKVRDTEPHKESHRNRVHNEAEFLSLVQSISLNGQRDAVKLYNGKIIDGRHRFYALKHLGIEYIKYVTIPGNTSLAEVIAEIESSEVRRSDTPSQKVAKAFMEYHENHKVEGESMRYYATKHGVGSHSSLSKCNTILDKLGYDIIRNLYQYGFVTINGKRYNTIGKILAYANSINEPSNEIKRTIPIHLQRMVGDAEALANSGDLEGASYMKKIYTGIINKLNQD